MMVPILIILIGLVMMACPKLFYNHLYHWIADIFNIKVD